ncbi:xylulokinase [Thermotoga profunda]|uniref:xylulokinase n=1 Tax=Thermotoga profunda TaxID=1508420 RepID=UPI000596C39F|nr:xylulokinase [Thermotoga profunda]
MSYVLAYDLGTTGNKATLFRNDGKLVASSFHPYETYFPNVNWVEQDPNQWWQSVKITTHEILDKAKIDKDEIKAISFSGQMMGVVPIDKDGNLLRSAIIWADQRSVEQASRLEKIGNEKIYLTTGSRITPTYFGPKIAWIKDNQPEIYKKTFKFLFPKDYIIYKLTGVFGTDFSDASMSDVFDIKEKRWSEELIQVLQIDIDKFPDVSSSLSIVGNILPKVASEIGLSHKTLVVRGAGDGPAATIGAGVFDSNEAYLYLGSSSWISTCSDKPFFDPQARTFNFCYPIPDLYCPTGTMQAGGGSYQWAKNTFCDLENKVASELKLDVYAILDDLIDKTTPGSSPLVFLPYLLGERSPRWNVNARGAFIGLSMTHTKPELLRAVLEGVTFNLKIILDIFEKIGGFHFSKIRLIGGGAKGRNWRQIIADIFERPVSLPEYLGEATSVGAAICGCLGAGLIDINDARNFVKDVQTIEPRSDFSERYNKLYEIFERSYQALKEIFDSLAKIT